MAVKNLITNKTIIIRVLNKPINIKQLSEETGVDEAICRERDSWFLHDGMWHYYKRFYNFPGGSPEEMKFINELMGEVLSKRLDIESIHYKIAENRGFIGLLSKNFLKPNQQYFFMKDLKLMSQFYDTSNLEKIRKLCKDDENYKELLSEIFKLVAIDLYMNQEDRNFTNMQFTRKDGELHLAPLYDFEDSCREPFTPEYSSAFLGMQVEEVDKYPLLGEYLNKLYSAKIGTVLEQIEDERKLLIPTPIKEKYEAYEEDRRMMLKR